jgi:hypothetical protein
MMKKTISFDHAARYGFRFPCARAWIDRADMRRLVADAALITAPNTTVPVEFLAYISPEVVRILTAPRNATEIFPEVKNGDWTTAYIKWMSKEFVGESQPYSDFAQTGKSDVNNDWNTREQYVFQTVIQYGDREAAMSSQAKIQLAAEKQEAAAHTIAVDANKFYLQGVAGLEIYGLLNDPNLPAAVVAKPGASTQTTWGSKTALEIYQDILDLFDQLAKQSQGLINQNSPLKLVMPPASSVDLGKATEYNVQVMDLVKKYFSDITVVILPELDTAAGRKVMLICPEIEGMKAAELAYGDKMIAGTVVRELSSVKQKFVSTTYGAIVKAPFAFAIMTDV